MFDKDGITTSQTLCYAYDVIIVSTDQIVSNVKSQSDRAVKRQRI